LIQLSQDLFCGVPGSPGGGSGPMEVVAGAGGH
jgi:hypothetical protein